jgi:glycosyltransferase involved in cell wall biosynthesis
VPTVAILTSLFFPGGRKDAPIIYSGADRYLTELCRLFKSKEWHVMVIQAGAEYWETEYEGCVVRGYPGTDFDFETNPTLNRIFNEVALSADLRIYFAPFVCFPQVVSPCIAICHGIWWDYPGHPLANGPENFKKEYFRRVEYGLTACDVTVCVDTAVIEFVRATWFGKDKRLCYIPNFVDTLQFHPPQEPKNWERPRVLYPRRLTTLRGSNELLWAVKELPEVD